MAKLTKKQKREKVNQRHGFKCEDCGKRDSSVRYTPCPFDEEMGFINFVYLCTTCEEDRADDI